MAPTCATCHMSPDQEPAGDPRHRPAHQSWNNRPPLSVRPEVSDAKMGLPGKDIPWQVRRENMKDVCYNCHNKQWVTTSTCSTTLWSSSTTRSSPARPRSLRAGQAAAKPYKAFSHPVDWYWFEIWHHEGRRARHGASMMGPDYTHWHGTYDVAKTFYTHYIPALKKLAKEAQESDDAAKIEGGKKLAAKIDAVLNSKDHQWFIDKMDPEERARRDKAREEFLKRYKH
jgi:hydroxylamine dehydrogenase